MSYILDALKRAEAERERERGAVPTLASSGSDKAAAGRSALVPVLVVLVLLLAGAALYAWLRPTPSAPSAPPVREIVREAAPPPVLVAPPSTRSTMAVAQAPTPQAAPPASLATSPAFKPSTVPAAQPAATPAAPAAIPALAELPPAVRQGMPAINVNGAVNAPAAADRLLFVNGQVLHEGDTIAAELRVETIGVHSAQLSWRGQRFHVDY